MKSNASMQPSPKFSSFSYRSLVVNLFIFYRCFQGHCSLDIRNVINDSFQELVNYGTSSSYFPESYNLSRFKSTVTNLILSNSLLGCSLSSYVGSFARDVRAFP